MPHVRYYKIQTRNFRVCICIKFKIITQSGKYHAAAAAAAAKSLHSCPTQTAAHQTPPSLGFSRQVHGVGCHFLLQCMKVKSESEVTQSCPTLSNPMDCSLTGSSVHREVPCS